MSNETTSTFWPNNPTPARVQNLESIVAATEKALSGASAAVVTATQQAANATTQASNALTSAQNAALTAAGVDTAVNNAKAYRDAAEGFKNQAQQAQAAADASNTTVTTLVGNAVANAQAAQNSATAADSSAKAASNSQTAAATSASQAQTYMQQSDSTTRVAKAGDTMTGDLTLQRGFLNLGKGQGGQAIPWRMFSWTEGRLHLQGSTDGGTTFGNDSFSIASNGAISTPQLGDIKTYIDGASGNKVLKAGDTMTGDLTLSRSSDRSPNMRWLFTGVGAWKARVISGNLFQLADDSEQVEYVAFGQDGSVRTKQLGDLKTYIDGKSAANGVTSGSSWVKLPGGLIIQWMRTTVNGVAYLNWPLAMTGVSSVVATVEHSDYNSGQTRAVKLGAISATGGYFNGTVVTSGAQTGSDVGNLMNIIILGY